MSYLGTFHIDDYVGIPAATHRFSSGAAYAPTALTYSIYEEATTTGLDEDVDMTPASPFDSITGCYWVRRQLTAAAGFEAGKNYLVVVKATVDSVAAIQMHTFQVEASSVAQTGDSYAIVNHVTYGNSALETLVDDLESRIGTPSDLGSGATVAANLVDIEGQTDDIGVAGAGLTAINLPDQTMNITGNITGNLSGSVGSVTTVSDKTGYALAADGLDAISTTAPAGAASNFREMMVQTWRRFFKKATMTSSELKTWDDAGTSVVTTQALSDDGTTQTQGAAS